MKKHTKRQIAIAIMQQRLDNCENDGDYLTLSTCLFALGVKPSESVDTLDVDFDSDSDAALFTAMSDSCEEAFSADFLPRKTPKSVTKRHIAISLLSEYLNRIFDDTEHFKCSVSLHALGVTLQDMEESIRIVDLKREKDAALFQAMIKECVLAHGKSEQLVKMPIVN